MKTLPWRIDQANPRKIVSDAIHGFNPLRAENVIGGASEHFEAIENAEAMVKAVNNTYGRGINPSGVPDLYQALKFVKDDKAFAKMDWKLKVMIEEAIQKAESK